MSNVAGKKSDTRVRTAISSKELERRVERPDDHEAPPAYTLTYM